MPAARIEAGPYRYPPYGLSVREIELITLIAAGMTNGEIADALQLSARTVTTHLANIMGKLSVANRTEIAATAFTEGLLSLPLYIDDAKLRALDIARIFRSRGHRDLLLPGSTRTRPRSGLLTVGALVPREGRASPDAIEMARGAQLAVEEINRRNGVHGRLVRLQTVDVDVDDLASVRHGVHSLLSSGVAAITSGYLRHQMEAMEMSSAEGMPFLHSSASSSLEQIAAGDRQRHQHVFQCCPTDTAYAPTFVRYMTKLRDDPDWSPQSNRLVIVQQRDWDFVDYGVREAETLAGQQGWDLQIIEATGSSEDTAVWARTATEAVGLTPAAIMLASYFVEEHTQFFTAVDQMRSRALRYAVYAPSLPEYRRVWAMRVKVCCGRRRRAHTPTISGRALRRSTRSGFGPFPDVRMRVSPMIGSICSPTPGFARTTRGTSPRWPVVSKRADTAESTERIPSAPLGRARWPCSPNPGRHVSGGSFRQTRRSLKHIRSSRSATVATCSSRPTSTQSVASSFPTGPDDGPGEVRCCEPRPDRHRASGAQPRTAVASSLRRASVAGWSTARCSSRTTPYTSDADCTVTRSFLTSAATESGSRSRGLPQPPPPPDSKTKDSPGLNWTPPSICGSHSPLSESPPTDSTVPSALRRSCFWRRPSPPPFVPGEPARVREDSMVLICPCPTNSTTRRTPAPPRNLPAPGESVIISKAL